MAATNLNNDEKLSNKNVSLQDNASRSADVARSRVARVLAELGSIIAEIKYLPEVEIESLKLLQPYSLTSEVLNELSSTVQATAKFVKDGAVLAEPIVISEDSFIIDGVKRVEVLKDLAKRRVNAITLVGLRCGGGELNRLRCLGLRTALNTVRWDTISAADRRRIVFSIAREALKTLDKDETERIRASLAKHEVPRVLVDIVIKTTGISYGTVYRALQYIVTVPQLRSALLNFEEHVDVKDELFNLTESVIEKLRSAPEDIRNDIIRRYLEGELTRIELSKVTERVATPKTVVEITTGGREETTREGRGGSKEVNVAGTIAEVRLERIKERVGESIERNVKELIEAIRAGKVDEDRIFIYELRRQYPKDLIRPIMLVLDSASRLFEDLIFLDRTYLYTLAQQLERVDVALSERDVILTLLRLMCGMATALASLPQFSNQRELVKSVCSMVISELFKYERQRQMGGQV